MPTPTRRARVISHRGTEAIEALTQEGAPIYAICHGCNAATLAGGLAALLHEPHCGLSLASRRAGVIERPGGLA